VQPAALLDRACLDLLPLSEDGFRPAEVDISRYEVAEALAVTLVVVVLDEGGDSSGSSSARSTICRRTWSGMRSNPQRGGAHAQVCAPRFCGPLELTKIVESGCTPKGIRTGFGCRTLTIIFQNV